jgi:hypothetical protein
MLSSLKKGVLSIQPHADIRFGNFRHMSACRLDRLVYDTGLWNSLSGCIKKSRLPMAGASDIEDG